MDFAAAPVTLILMLTIALVSINALWVDRTLIDRLKFIPSRQGQSYRWVTSAFVHGGFWHLFANLFTLFFFGPPLEHWLGPINYLLLYAGSMLCCSAVTYALFRHDHAYSAIGASGAIVGVLFGYCLFRPLDLLYFFGVIPVPAIGFALLFVAGSLWAIRKGFLPGIAHEGHLGGAAGGALLTIILEPAALQLFLRQLGL